MTGAGALIGLVTVAAALGLVVLLAYVTLKLLKAGPGMQGGSGSPVRFLRSVPVGRNERVTLVAYRGEVFLLGVAQGGVTLLARMEEEPPPEGDAAPVQSAWLAERFKAAMSAARRGDGVTPVTLEASEEPQAPVTTVTGPNAPDATPAPVKGI